MRTFAQRIFQAENGLLPITDGHLWSPHTSDKSGADVLSRRHFLGATGAVAVATALGGCGDKAGSGADAKATLQMTWWGSTDRHKRTQDALTEFRKKHPN